MLRFLILFACLLSFNFANDFTQKTIVNIKKEKAEWIDLQLDNSSLNNAPYLGLIFAYNTQCDFKFKDLNIPCKDFANALFTQIIQELKLKDNLNLLDSENNALYQKRFHSFVPRTSKLFENYYILDDVLYENTKANFVLVLDFENFYQQIDKKFFFLKADLAHAKFHYTFIEAHTHKKLFGAFMNLELKLTQNPQKAYEQSLEKMAKSLADELALKLSSF